MKPTFIALLALCLPLGCGKERDENQRRPVGFPSENPVKELKEEDVLGTYEATRFIKGAKITFLDNGWAEAYKNGKKRGKVKWGIVANEIHVGGVEIYRVESNGDLTLYAAIKEGKRQEAPKEVHQRWKKLKE